MSINNRYLLTKNSLVFGGYGFSFSPKVRAFSDESLESYVLRVVAENFFDSYQQLSLAIREELHELDFEAHGAFPIELKRLNVYHAQHNSHFRMRALGLLESLLDLPNYELQKLALLRSNRRFLGSLSAVHRNGVDIPLSFIRYGGEDGVESVPICPQCLQDEPYIRQAWHIRPVEACAKHECELLHHCPECDTPINYIENESITYCTCGFEFATASSVKAKSHACVLPRSLFEGDALSNNPLLFWALLLLIDWPLCFGIRSVMRQIQNVWRMILLTILQRGQKIFIES